jgi:hypothetical protein
MLQKILSKLLLCLGLVGLGALLSGCASGYPPSGDDGSIQLLTSLFGSNLDLSLSGSLNTALAFPVLVHAFNMGLMGAAMLIFSYIAIMGTLYTAQDGVFLGKKWGKTFIPLRAVFGIIAIFPLGSTGFGIAQYIIYAMTYAGVGLADGVWKSVSADAQTGGLSPGIPLNVLQGVYAALGEMVFYDVVNGVLNPPKTTTSFMALAGNSNSLCAGSTGSSQDFCLITPLTKELFNKMNMPVVSSASANCASTKYPNTPLQAICSSIYSTASSGDKPWVDGVLNIIQGNLIDNTIPDSANVGNIQYLLNDSSQYSSNGQPSPIHYVESDIQLYVKGQLSPLTSPPANIGNATEKAQTGYSPSTLYPNDPVSTAYQTSKFFSQGILSSGQGFNVDLFLSGAASVIGAMTTYYQDNKSHKSKTPENFSDSWWLAGDEYLYLDSLFAEESATLTKMAQQFQTAIVGTSQNLVTINQGGIYTNLTELDLTQNQSTPMFPNVNQIVDCAGSGGSGSACAYVYYPLTGVSLFLPTSVSQYLGGLASQSASWTGNAQIAAFDLLCKFGGTVTPTGGSSGIDFCRQLKGLNLSTRPDIQSPIEPLDLTVGPMPAVLQDLYYYFAIKNTGSTSPVYTQDEITKLDIGVNYAYDAYLVANSSNPCPPASAVTGSGSLACNPNNPGFSNPMIIAGQASPMGNALGFIFSGLIGAQQGQKNIAGLMAQIWCVGEVDFGGCIQNIQTTGASSGIQKPSAGVVSDHFSVIANTQWVGMNLISGSVAALTSIYKNFGEKMETVINSLEGADNVSAGAFAAMSIPGFGGIASASYGEKLIKQTTAATVSIAAQSVNLMWLPVIMIVLTTLFTTGVMFAIFIPLLPFVLFWAGKIAWILLVIESIFAAPLMALAMAYPEGHDLWGMGEQGLKISLNLLLMPVLMIVGLVSAMAITYFVLNMTSSGFHYVTMSLLGMAKTTSQGGSGLAFASSSIEGVNSLFAQGIMTTFLVFMYASFVSMAFNKSFSTIYVIPERVMSWIGSQGMKFGEKEAGEMQGAVSKQADQAAQGGGQAVSQGTQAQKGLADAKVSQVQQEGQAEIQIGQAIGTATTQTVQTAASAAGG